MPDRIQQNPHEPSVDPIAFDDEKTFGLDPAVHWIHFNNQREQLSEIVFEIVKHWNDVEWLKKLINRLGYNPNIYDSATNPKGIFLKEFTYQGQHRSGEMGKPALRFFALRAAGVKSELCNNMFGIQPGLKYINLASASYNEMIARRRTLVGKTKKR